MFTDEYNPYDERNTQNKCRRGYYIGNTRYCCRECWINQH